MLARVAAPRLVWQSSNAERKNVETCAMRLAGGCSRKGGGGVQYVMGGRGLKDLRGLSPLRGLMAVDVERK